MLISTRPAEEQEIASLRDLYRQEMNCQIVHDSIHHRPGWTLEYLLSADKLAVGYGSVAIGGPWKGKPTVYEFYVLPDYRLRAFDLFESFLAASQARFLEIQTNCLLLSVMMHTYGRDLVSESTVFRDSLTTGLLSDGMTIRRTTSEDDVRTAIEERQGGGEWVLEEKGTPVAKGGILFHYNRPYGDIYMEVSEPYRRRGFGSLLVQELKRECYELGAIPAARCNSKNIPSRRTLQKAGFVPYAHIVTGSIHFESAA